MRDHDRRITILHTSLTDQSKHHRLMCEIEICRRFVKQQYLGTRRQCPRQAQPAAAHRPKGDSSTASQTSARSQSAKAFSANSISASRFPTKSILHEQTCPKAQTPKPSPETASHSPARRRRSSRRSHAATTPPAARHQDISHPDATGSVPFNALISVVFPAPFAPSNAMIRPSFKVSETSRKTSRSPYLTTCLEPRASCQNRERERLGPCPPVSISPPNFSSTNK